ncbi:ATPase expression protein 2, mitochondrial [Penicillium digitatum]|uniref:ATPase expression protein 2, mitochondrial n=2 Tax=Penicillium digitatum TaxID=36651 RepID=A0A7T6XFW8_PENDI|nr:ATPase expression protein 2, mitochondrial [Penicillium digitatum]
MRRFSLTEKFASRWGASSRHGDNISKRRQFPPHCNLSHARQVLCVAASSNTTACDVASQRTHQTCCRNSIRQLTTTSQRWNNELAVPRPMTFENEVQVPLPEWSSPAEEARYRTYFFRVLENGQPNQVKEAMVDPRSVELVGLLPPAVFIKALHLLSPAHFVIPYRDLHHTLHGWGVLMLGLKTLEAMFDDFTRDLLTIIQYRTVAGYPPQLAEYTHLFNCAQAMGNGPLVNALWDGMYANDVTPDTVCYNHYMSALVWNHCYVGKEAYHTRIIPHSYKKRRMIDPNPGWRGYATAWNSVKGTVLDIFSQMSQDGLTGNEQTYINILLAAARVGDMEATKSTLKTVWNVDVDAISAERDNSMLPPVTPYDTWSGLYPTEHLLFAVAHAFGTNNDMYAAMRTVDFMASSYNINISAKVWSELLERTFTLSKEHKRRQAEDGRTGQVPRDMVRDLFEILTTEPYNVPATLQMYRFLTQTNKLDRNLKACKRDMRKAYKVLSQTRAKRKEARNSVMQCLQPVLDSMKPPANGGRKVRDETKHQRQTGMEPDLLLLQCPLLAEAINTYDLLRLEVFQQIYQLQRIAYSIIITDKWSDISPKAWELQERPKLLEEWKDFLPERNRYEYRDGDVGIIDFQGETNAKSRHMSQHGRIHARRMPDESELFHPIEPKVLDDRIFWEILLREYPQLDPSVSPLNRIYSFQVEHTKELREKLRKLKTRVDYPEEHPLSQENNSSGGFYGRIHALGFDAKPQNSIFWRDSNPWC